MLTILIIDDHPMMSAALADLLQQLAPQVKCVAAATGAAAIQQVTGSGNDFDLIVLDLGLPDTDGFDLLVRLRDRCPATPIAVVSASDDQQAMRRAAAAGALGFVAKSAPPAILLQALRQVLQGDPYLPSYPFTESSAFAIATPEPERPGLLSRHQLDVLRLLCRGISNKAIAQELNLAEKTVKGRVTTIFKTLGVVNRTQAVLKANEHGLLSDC